MKSITQDTLLFYNALHGSSPGKESACNAGDVGLIPGWKDPLEKGVATHLLPGKSPWTEEPDGLQFMRWQSWTH